MDIPVKKGTDRRQVSRLRPLGPDGQDLPCVPPARALSSPRSSSPSIMPSHPVRNNAVLRVASTPEVKGSKTSIAPTDRDSKANAGSMGHRWVGSRACSLWHWDEEYSGVPRQRSGYAATGRYSWMRPPSTS